MARAFAEHLTALTDKQLWLDNPLAVRDARREFRHNRVFYAILTLSLTVLALAIYGGWMLYNLVKYSRHVPDSLGGNIGTAIAILVSGTHFWWVARAAQGRVDGMLMREASLDGMTSLLMLPIPRLSLVVQAAAYPWMAAAVVSILLLPVYIFCVGIDAISWAEFFSLYVLFALAAVSLPSFRRPALSGTVAATMLNQAIDDPNAEPSSGFAPFRKSGAQAGFGALTLIGFIPVIFIVMSIFMGFSSRQIYTALDSYVPQSILSLVPSSIVSLPFMTARLMITALGFFQWTIYPLPLIVTLALLRKYLNLLRTSEFLSVGQYRDLAGLSTYKPRRTAEFYYRMMLIIVAAGFLWPWGVRDGGISFLAPNPAAKDAGISGMIFLSLFSAAAWAIIRAGRIGTWMRPNSGSDETLRTFSFRSAVRYCAAPFGVCAAIAILCLILDGDFLLARYYLT
jgi:hypothetical protein